jgi:hypothetical protein
MARRLQWREGWAGVAFSQEVTTDQAAITLDVLGVKSGWMFPSWLDSGRCKTPMRYRQKRLARRIGTPQRLGAGSGTGLPEGYPPGSQVDALMCWFSDVN